MTKVNKETLNTAWFREKVSANIATRHKGEQQTGMIVTCIRVHRLSSRLTSKESPEIQQDSGADKWAAFAFLGLDGLKASGK